MTGLLIDGSLVPVPGITVIPPASQGGPSWAMVDPGDCCARATRWVRQVILHTTMGKWPQTVLPGSGARHAEEIANFWREDPVHSAAHLVVDRDGSVACLCDLARVMTYHAEGSNPWSIGIEMYQNADGGVYEATLSAAVALVHTLCEVFAIPEQIPRGPYRGVPLMRMETETDGGRHQIGGPDIVGVLGHRDNTSERGRGDPGDEIWVRLAAAGFEPLDYVANEDLMVGKRRQAVLNARGERLTLDGLVGPESMAAARRQGFARWRDVQ